MRRVPRCGPGLALGHLSPSPRARASWTEVSDDQSGIYPSLAGLSRGAFTLAGAPGTLTATRRLAAILAADYARLIGEDEAEDGVGVNGSFRLPRSSVWSGCPGKLKVSDAGPLQRHGARRGPAFEAS